MNFLLELWVVIAAGVLGWFSSIDNNTLNIIVNLLTILVITIGLVDWSIRKIRARRMKKKQEQQQKQEHQQKQERHQVLELIENTQKPFKTVQMLENPMGTSEAIGNIFDKIFKKLIGGQKMKKFFKWVWYNKEQLLSIIYQIVLLALANIVLFTDTFNTLTSIYLGVPLPLGVKIVIVVLALALTALSVRNVIVKYGLSSLDTINAVLEERAAIKASQLTPEQKKVYKGYISTLNNTLNETRKKLRIVEEEYNKITLLYNADNSLVADYSSRVVTYQQRIATDKETITAIEEKIAKFKALLSGQTSDNK